MRDLDRGTLAKIDRKLLSGLGHNEAWQMVRVPAAEAMWSAWKRYCDILDVSMGRGVAALIQNELRAVVDDMDESASLITLREAELAKRQRMFDAKERTVEIREQAVEAIIRRQHAMMAPKQQFPKVGRNDPCPCGSRVKYKRCHGG